MASSAKSGKKRGKQLLGKRKLKPPVKNERSNTDFEDIGSIEDDVNTLFEKPTSQEETLAKNSPLKIKLFKKPVLKRRGYSSTALIKAYESVTKDSFSVSGAAKLFGVPPTTLRDRVMGRIDIGVEKMGREPILSVEEERRLADHLSKHIAQGFRYTHSEIADLASEFAVQVGKRDKDDKPLTVNWFKGFKTRWPDINFEKAALKTKKSTKLVKSKNGDSYVSDLDEIFIKYELKDRPESVYNIVEKAIMLEERETAIELSSDLCSSLESPIVTILGGGNAVGQQIPPFFVFKGSSMTDEFLKGLSVGTNGTVSETGSLNSDVFEKYIYHFLKYAKSRDPEQKLLLLFKGHFSHVSLGMTDFAFLKNIVLFAFPRHNSNSDDGCFGPFQHVYDMMLQKHLFQNSDKPLNKQNICKLVCKAYLEALSPSNLQSTFRQMGLYPYNDNFFYLSQIKTV